MRTQSRSFIPRIHAVARAGRRFGRFARGDEPDGPVIATGKPLRAAACPCHTACRRLAVLTLLTLLCLASPAAGQVLQARWVEESEARIEEIRKADVRVIVIDKQGNPVANCSVRIEQQRHDFLFGLRLPRGLPADAPSKKDIATTPLWRAFNAVALDSVASWPATQPKLGQWDFTKVQEHLAFAHERNLTARWGSVISTDPGRMPAWAAGLKGDDLRQAIEAHAEQVIDRFGRHVEQFDLVTHLIDHQHLENELGMAGIRRLYAMAQNRRAGGQVARGRSTIAFDDAFAPDRLQRALRLTTRLREGFVPIESIAVEVRFSGSLVEAPITRNLEWMGNPGLPVVITNMEVAGPSPAAIAVNLETALRAMFSQPSVQGIFFAGLREEELHHPEAALIDEDGLTQAGTLLDRMVRHHWWTDITASTDELGNINQRIFAGSHHVTATLPDGSIADGILRIGPGESKLIVLQPVKPERKPVQVVKEDDANAQVPVAAGGADDDALVKPVVDAQPVPSDSSTDEVPPQLPAEPTPASPPKSVPVKQPPASIPGRARLEFTPER